MEQLNLGAPGFAGICRETYRVLLRAIPNPNEGGRGDAFFFLYTLLLAYIATNRAFLSLLDDDGHLPGAAAFLLLSLVCTAGFLFPCRATSLHCADGDSNAFDLVLRNLPRAPLTRLFRFLLHGFPLAQSYTIFYIAICLVRLLLDPSKEVDTLLLRVIGAGACLAGAAYACVVLHIACVVSMLERGNPISDLSRSRALLVGKFWAAAAVFVPLDACFVALETALLLLTREDALELGRGFQVAAGVAMSVALWAVVVVTMVAQLVVYLVCKNHHHEVVVVHMGVELQAEKTEQIPPAGQSPAGTST